MTSFFHQVHFLMAQAANYVHVTRELQESRQIEEIKMDGVMMATSRFGPKDETPEKEKLVFTTTDNGSVDLVDT